MIKVFVYGTLKEGGRFSHQLKKHLKAVYQGTINGSLYDLGAYPAALLIDDSRIIYGEIHVYAEAAQPILNRIEGYKGENVSDNLYNREIVEATDEHGNSHICQVYTFNGALPDELIIEEGVWNDEY